MNVPGRILSFLTAVLLLGCSANRMYRPAGVEEYADYSLAFIEFDDQGELWSPSQLDRALGHLERLNTTEYGTALVIFAHGWNADASPGQEAKEQAILNRYKAMLARLAEGIREDLPGADLPVMGIYLGWRGRVSSIPIVREASFYNRRGAAERIAGASATEAIYRILTALRENPSSRSVLIGHSFGSIILERALAQAVIGALLASPGKELLFPADLVVLLNPAGSASRTKQLVDILARNRLKTYRFDADGHRFERPLLVSFTSETDTATKLFFPAGMRLKAATKKFRSYGDGYCSPISNQRRLYTHTAGNLPELHSHEVTVSRRSTLADEEMQIGRNVPSFLGYEEHFDPLTQQMAFSFNGEKHRFTVRRKPVALNDTPYWIMQVPRELIPNHSAVLTEDTFRLIEAILVLGATYDADITTVVEREDGVRPVAVVPRPDGSALIVDRGRGVYAVEPQSTRPVFLYCLPPQVDPGNAIGFHVAGHLAYAVLMSRQKAADKERCQTDLLEFEVLDDGYRQLPGKRLAGSSCYSAATIDLPGKRLLLGLETEAGAEIRSADLTERSPRPRQLLGLPFDRPPTSLHFESSLDRLFASRGPRGEIFAIDLDAADPEPRLIGDELGWPAAIAFSKADRRLYVSDSAGRRIWSFDCADECGPASVFVQSTDLDNPTTLAVALDGTLWIGDRHRQTLTSVAPDGQRGRTFYSLSGNRDSGSASRESIDTPVE